VYRNLIKQLIFFVASLVCFTAITVAQTNNKVIFGKLSEKDIKVTNYPLDSNAGAFIISDVGNSEIIGNDNGGFSLVFHRFFRIHVLNSRGYKASEVSFLLYTANDDKEELKDLAGITYNLENGKIIESKLDNKNSVYSERVDKDHYLIKFAMPAVKEGSIIDCKYSIHSSFIFNLQPWSFQHSYPVLWSEYNIQLPQFFNYVSITQGFNKYFIATQQETIKNFAISTPKEGVFESVMNSDRTTISASVTNFRWVMKDVPALIEESFTSSINNHFSRIEFQLSETRSPLVSQKIMPDWPQASKTLLNHEKFGQELLKDNFWLKEVISKIIAKGDSEIEKARKIFYFVRNRMTSTGRNEIMLSQTLKETSKNNNGNVADINMLLVAMFREIGLIANPVVLSLRSNGYPHNVYPLLNRYNYLVCELVVENSKYYLDASIATNQFNKLSPDCYNGQGRVINEESSAIYFLPDSLRENETITLFAANDGNGRITGRFSECLGLIKTDESRNIISTNGLTSYIEEYKKGFIPEIIIQNIIVDSLTMYENPLRLTTDFETPILKEEYIYWNPIIKKFYEHNPFKSTKRLYPVEMPFTISKTYQSEMEIPEGYIVDELPASIVVKFNDKADGVFEYKISKSSTRISFYTKLRINRTYFLPEEYDMLREFFNLVVKKQSEQIVFKKK
jgi:Domain of Unknown Function with PDB structure (DUF3857)/Transglutaminase-like superfamily